MRWLGAHTRICFNLQNTIARLCTIVEISEPTRARAGLAELTDLCDSCKLWSREARSFTLIISDSLDQACSPAPARPAAGEAELPLRATSCRNSCAGRAAAKPTSAKIEAYSCNFSLRNPSACGRCSEIIDLTPYDLCNSMQVQGFSTC